MGRFVLLLLGGLLLCGSGIVPASARTLTDSAGRTVTLPDRVETVFAAGPPATVFLYTLAPETLAGWSRPLHADERPYVPERYRDLPTLGRLTGRGGTANLEAVLASKPDLIFDFGSTAPTYVSLADRVQAQTGIPAILIDGRFGNTAAALRLLGEALGRQERAEELARYTERTLAEVDAIAAQVPQDRRPRVYLARGPVGLETGVRGSINTEIIERAGGINVADAPGQRGIVNVSLEQVLAWNPEVIITWDERGLAHMLTDARWRNVRAVQTGRLYLAPSVPFGWIDRPPSINRLLGLRWLATVLYPDIDTGDMRAITREFYRLFYHVELDEALLAPLLAGPGR